MNKKPITLPIDSEIVRCLAHTNEPRVWCDRRANCAAHETIRFDTQDCQVVERKCSSDFYVGYLPLDGFPDNDEATK